MPPLRTPANCATLLPRQLKRSTPLSNRCLDSTASLPLRKTSPPLKEMPAQRRSTTADFFPEPSSSPTIPASKSTRWAASPEFDRRATPPMQVLYLVQIPISISATTSTCSRASKGCLQTSAVGATAALSLLHATANVCTPL